MNLARIALLPLPLLWAACAGTGSGDKVVLRLDAPAGSAFRRELDGTMRGSLVVRAEGKESRQPLVKDERRVVEDEILESTAEGIQKVRRKTVEWTLRRQGPDDAAAVSVPRTMVGKTIVLLKTELGTEHEGAQGIPADELRENPIDALDAILSLPDHAVSPGDSWDIDGDHLVAVFGGDGSRGMKVREASGRARLERIDAAGTGRVALITVRIEASGALRQLLDVDLTLSLQGSFRINLDQSRPVSFELQGKGTMSGEVARAKGPAVYEGSFTVDLKGKVSSK